MMGGERHRPRSSGLWEIARRQHGVVARRQLIELGYGAKAIEHRIAKGRLHPTWRGVYAIGRPALTQKGRWMAAVLSCGERAFLSHESAAALWRIRRSKDRRIDISVLADSVRRRPDIALHRRSSLERADITHCDAIPVTTPICTLIDLAIVLDPSALEAAINEADKCDLTDPEELRSTLDVMKPRPGVRVLRKLLDASTFRLTDSELERLFLRTARKAGLPPPNTGCWINGFKVDFYWPDLRLVVETDGLRYHRTSAQQARDRHRDQVHIAAGDTPLRFTHGQIRYKPGNVEATLRDVARRLQLQLPADALAPS
jgi:very-short-patch-repair endonuclease